ncbi:venom acid phosphatase Acph-1 [Tribolium castaneum]|uniref:venom acid phosphatase Acph-1 n=1 Tax=Tribolium castaneum TaxID=7070 RepID=UPI0030FF0911
MVNVRLFDSVTSEIPKMQFHSFRVFFWSLYFLAQQFASQLTENVADNDTLVLLHVVFRHGNRTANGPEELYPKDPYLNETYFPFGLGQLTNAGKVGLYSIGKALRKRYNNFLGPFYHPELVEGWSTDYNRTKMSLELVFAGLFPPQKEEMWNQDLPWHPIPYNYYQRSDDKVLLGMTCPPYMELYDTELKSEKYQNKVSKYKEIFAYISNNTGLNVTTFLDVYNLYFGLSTEEEWGFELPEWTKPLWPKTIVDLSIQEYFTATATTEMSRMACGYFLQKLIADTNTKIQTNSGRKIYLYSGHENNIAELLLLLGIFEPLHIPEYGSYLTFEVHKIGDEFGIKIYYENYTGDGPKLMKLPACETFCEISKFLSLIDEYMPVDDPCSK